MNCKQLPWITKKKERNKQSPTIRSGILRASFWWERRTDEASDFIYDSSDLPSSQQSWRHSCPRPGDPSCVVLCWVLALRQFLSPQRACPPVRPSQWTRRTSAARGRARRAVGVCGECSDGCPVPTSSSQHGKGSFSPHCLFSQKCPEIARLCMAFAGVWYQANY